MAVRHLTDMEFQSYLDKNKPSNNRFIDDHLKRCKECRQELKAYRLLYNSLKRDTGYNLNPGFSDAVITRLVAAQTEKPQSILDKVLIFAGILIAIAAGGFFLDINKIAAAMAGPFIPLFNTMKNLSANYIETLHISGSSFGILLFSALIFVAVYFADNLLLNYKEKRFCL
ncbi:MAG: hypothetical protein ABIJ12_14815 [bacterium]